jgi:hypothetical protein
MAKRKTQFIKPSNSWRSRRVWFAANQKMEDGAGYRQ